MLKNFFAHPLFKDPRATLLAVTGLLLVMVHSIDFLINIESQEIKIPIRYSGYNESLDDKGHWVSLAALLFFGVVVFVINMAISLKVYKLRKTLALTLLTLNIVVLVFLILVSRALLGLV
jgi:hypothetical protein